MVDKNKHPQQGELKRSINENTTSDKQSTGEKKENQDSEKDNIFKKLGIKKNDIERLDDFFQRADQKKERPDSF